MDIAALKAVSGRLQQRALARLSLKSPPNRIAREDAALDQEAATSILSMIARLEALEEALKNARQYVALAVEDDGGIDNCEIGDRITLERIDAALEPAP